MSATTPPPDPIAYLLDTVYSINIHANEIMQKTVHEISENPQVQQVADWITSQKDQLMSNVESLPNINLPQVIKTRSLTPPTPPPPPPSFASSISAKSYSLVKRAGNWISEHKLLTGFIVIGVTSSAFAGVIYTRNVSAKRRKRRFARKAANGARIEAVVLASSPREPIAKIIAADLERRGFIVFMTVQPGEEHLVLKEDSPDIRPLILPSPDSIERNSVVDKFADLVDRQQHLAGVIILPDLYYPTGPVESLSAYDWSDILYSKVVGSVALLSQGFIPLVRRHNARFLLITPSILPSLCPPFHAPECVISSALSAFALCMHRELKPQGIPFIHLRLGSFDMSVPLPSSTSFGPSSPFMSPDPSSGRPASQGSHSRSYSPATSPSRSVSSTIRAHVLSWPENIRNIYGRAYSTAVRAISCTASSLASTASSHRATGSSLNELNIAIFDCLTSDSSSSLTRIQFVGRGSFLYYFLGGLLPETAIEWVLGFTIPDGANYFRTMSLSKSDPVIQDSSQDTPDSPLSSGISGSPYISETESTHHDLASSWERV
ncbi:hypothetical protein V1511DRAFT_505451 [Dipodascopsis uninucleata]